MIFLSKYVHMNDVCVRSKVFDSKVLFRYLRRLFYDT